MFANLPRTIILGTSSNIGKVVWNKQSVAIALSNKVASRGAQNREYHEVTGDIICPSMVMGIDHLRDPRLNKGLAFTLEERQVLGIHGLQPARFKTQEEQLELCRLSVERYQEDLNKYLYLVELQDRNERLFFRLLSENIEKMMPIVYTPTVGLACQKFGLIYRRPRGLFITLNDRGHIFNILKNWPEPDVKCIVVTDGERILGLGDLGACGMGIPVGKLALYTALAGIKPHQCLPIMLDVGTNNKTLLEDPLYIGLRRNRCQGTEYDDFVDEFMDSVVRRYGQDTLIQFEDFGNANAFRFLDKYRNKYCTFNDDIQGTASVAVAGLMAARKVIGKKISDMKFQFLGAGEAASGIATLLVKAMEKEGTSTKDAYSKIWMNDIHGLLVQNRTERLDKHQMPFAKDHAPEKDLLKLIKEVKPTVLIGASAAAGAFTPEILKEMAANNPRPIIFALSNPTSRAECTAQQAYDYTEARCLFSSGSPFPPVTVNNKTFKTGQGNNAYIFPGVGLGVLAAGIHHISEDLFLIAAETVAENLTKEDVEMGSLYPPLSKIMDCSMEIALRIADYAYNNGTASTYPRPDDMRQFIESRKYNYNYDSPLPDTFAWPKLPEIKTRAPIPTKLSA